jgi:hypothetical protein
MDGYQIDNQTDYHQSVSSDNPYIDIFAPPVCVLLACTLFEHHLTHNSYQRTDYDQYISHTLSFRIKSDTYHNNARSDNLRQRNGFAITGRQ